MAFDYTEGDTGQRFVIFWKDYPEKDKWTPVAYLNTKESAIAVKDLKLSRQQLFYTEMKIVDRQTNATIYHIDMDTGNETH